MARHIQKLSTSELTAAKSRAPQLSRRGKIADAAKNVGALALLWVAYSAVRSLSGDNLTDAVKHSANILLLQESIGFPQESLIQREFLDHVGVFRAANLYYMWAHFPVTGAFLAWTWLFRRAYFSIIRNVLIIVTATGLAIHVIYPLAPPRMLPNFIDTGILFGPSPYDLDSAAKAANQLAAMPSLHVGWALLVSLSFIAISRSRLRFLSLAHPAITAFVVVLTANHYWTDAIVAVALVMIAWTLVWRREQRLALREIRARNISSAPNLFAQASGLDTLSDYFPSFWPSDKVAEKREGATLIGATSVDTEHTNIERSGTEHAENKEAAAKPPAWPCRSRVDKKNELWGNDPRLDELDSVGANQGPFGANCPFGSDPGRHRLSNVYRDCL